MFGLSYGDTSYTNYTSRAEQFENLALNFIITDLAISVSSLQKKALTSSNFLSIKNKTTNQQ